MSDNQTLIERALQRRHEIAEEWERIEKFLQTAADLLETSVENLINEQTSTLAMIISNQQLDIKSSKTVVSNKDTTPNMPQHQFVEIARHIIISKARPLTSHQILEGFRDLGQKIGGADELRNLTTKLWRAKEEIVRIKGFYWIADLPYFDLNYIPENPPGEEVINSNSEKN